MKLDYQELLNEIGKDNFESRFAELQRQIDMFLNEGKYEQSVVCNDRILYHVLLDYYSDIARLKEFHGIKHTKTDKKIAYLIYWFLRRKPIQYKEYSENEKDIYANERFCCCLLINECLLPTDDFTIDTKLDDEQMKIFDRYLDLLLYFLKYRHVNPQELELVIETFKIGRLFPVKSIPEGEN